MFNVIKGQLSQFIGSHRDPDAVWFLHHIPKTAGSSLASEISLAVGEESYINLVADYGAAGQNYMASLDSLTAHAVERVNGPNPPRVLSGHLGADHVDRLVTALPQLKLFTFVRHPVARIISEYNYCCSPRHPLNAQFSARYPTIEEYLAEPGEMNKIARMMFGTDQIDPKEAVARMMDRYTMIGMQERYPASFLLMASMIWEPSMPHKQERVGAAKAPPSPELTRQIVQANALDMALFAHVQGVYDTITPEIWDVLSSQVAVG